MISAETLWRRYKRTGDSHAREELVGACQSVVASIAKQISPRLPAHLRDLSELASYGFDGVLAAIEDFDPQRAEFERYLSARVKWAIYDALRESDSMPRYWRVRVREIEQATARLRNELNRTPTPQEMAVELQCGVKQYESWLLAISQDQSFSLDRPVGSESANPLMDIVEDCDISTDPQKALEISESNDRLNDAFSVLPAREREIINSYYGDEISQSDIAKRLGISHPRVSQIHKRALNRLQTCLGRDCQINEVVIKLQGQGVRDYKEIANHLIETLSDKDLRAYAAIALEKQVAVIIRQHTATPSSPKGSKWDVVRNRDPGDWAFEVGGELKSLKDFTQADVEWMANRYRRQGQTLIDLSDRWKETLDTMREQQAQTISDISGHIDLVSLLPV